MSFALPNVSSSTMTCQEYTNDAVSKASEQLTAYYNNFYTTQSMLYLILPLLTLVFWLVRYSRWHGFFVSKIPEAWRAHFDGAVESLMLGCIVFTVVAALYLTLGGGMMLR